MSTPVGRDTYGAWLDKLGETGRTDPAGLVASGWLAAKANGRPRYSATKSVNAWLAGEGRHPGVADPNKVLHALQRAYNAGEAPERAALPEGAPAPQEAPQQAAAYRAQPDQAGDWPDGTIAVAQRQDGSWDVQDPAGWRWAGWWVPDRGWVTGDEQEAPGQEPVEQQFEPEPTEYQAGAMSQEDFQALVMGHLLAIKRSIETFAAIISPLAQLVEATEVQMASEPPAAVQAALGIAEQYGWTQGPGVADAAEQVQAAAAPATRPDFYGGHVVPPDFAQMATESDGQEGE